MAQGFEQSYKLNDSSNASVSVSLKSIIEDRPSTLEVWGFGLLAVTIINSCAIIGIAIMPMLGRSSHHYLLTLLIGLGVGSLSGSALFHLIPEVLEQ